jgi:hypothetical protein
MSGMAQVADRVAYAIGKVGEPAVLVRLPGRTGTRRELALKAVMVFGAPSTTTGGVVQSHDEIRISNAEIAASGWPLPIRRGDQIILGGQTYTVQGVTTASPGGFPAEHFLQVMGQS